MSLSPNETFIITAHPFSVETLAASLQYPTNVYMLDTLLDKSDLENVELGRVYVEDDDLFELFGDNALRSEHTTTIKQLKQFESLYRDQYGDSAEDDFLELFETIETQDLPDDTLVSITIE